MTVVCYGELLWDLFPGERRLGGAAANVAYHAAQLGETSVLLSRVGDDELGALARQSLLATGVSVEFVQIDATAPTGTVHVEFVDGEPRYRIATRVAWDRIEWQDALKPVLESASAVCFGTLAQREPLGFDVLERALGHAGGAVRICDLNVRPPFASRETIERALRLASVAKLNQSELAAISEICRRSDAVTWMLEELGLDLVAVTLGAQGSLFATREVRHREPAAPLTSGGGDPVGAGDAFTAVLAHGLPRGMPLAELAALASRYAAHVASFAGAMPAAPGWLKA